MENLEVGNLVKVIKTGRVGMITEKTKHHVQIRFADKSVINTEIMAFRNEDVKKTKMKRVKYSQLAEIVRGELSLRELSGGSNYVSDEIQSDSKVYMFNIDDFYAGFKKMSGKSLEEIAGWLTLIAQFSEFIGEFLYAKDEIYSLEDSFAGFVFDSVMELLWMITENKEDEEAKKFMDVIKSIIKEYIESDGKTVPGEVIYELVRRLDCDNIDEQDEVVQVIFKEGVDKLCAAKDPMAIQKRGYCYYTGTGVYPNDWVKARNSFLEYFEITADPTAANTLGYIYYYGRCNNGVSQYDEAFKYFSIGNAAGIYESTYKLADMFRHGNGVAKSEKIAFHMYEEVYTQTLCEFQAEIFECKFADAALRMGNCFKEGIGCEVDYALAYQFYLEADYAIRRRVEATNYYGDNVVYESIQKALEETRELYTVKSKKMVFEEYPIWALWMIRGHRNCYARVNKLKNDKFSIKATTLPRYDELEFKALITVPEADYSELRSEIRIKTDKYSKFFTDDGEDDFIFDHVEYDRYNNITRFMLGTLVVATIITDKYTFTPTVSAKKKGKGTKFRFVSICFSKGGRTYDYLCNDTTVKPGDEVVVNGYNGETVVKVQAVKDVYESELGLPLDRYREIVRKK